MRQWAWLQAVPRAPQQQTLGNTTPAAPQRRLERLLKDGVVPQFPPVEIGEYLIEYLMEAGPAQAGGMGMAPLSHQEISAWCLRSGHDIAPWESRLLRRLSKDYVGQIAEAEAPDCPAPWGGPTNDIDRAAIGRRVGAVFRTALQVQNSEPKPKLKSRKGRA